MYDITLSRHDTLILKENFEKGEVIIDEEKFAKI